MALLNPFFDFERRKQYFKTYRWQPKNCFYCESWKFIWSSFSWPYPFSHRIWSINCIFKDKLPHLQLLWIQIIDFLFFLSRLFNDFLLQFFGLYTHSTYPSLFLLKWCIFSKLSFYVKWFVRNLDSPCCFLYFYSSHELFHIGKLSHSWNEHCISK